MLSFTHQELLPYQKSSVYSVVANIELYSEFLPGCDKVCVLKRENNTAVAEMFIRYGFFQESFVTKVQFNEDTICVEHMEGPFHSLTNRWVFEPCSENETRVSFFISLDISHAIWEKMLRSIFYRKAKEIMEAFRKRIDSCQKLSV